MLWRLLMPLLALCATVFAQTDPGIPDLTTRETAREWHNTYWPKTRGALMGYTGNVLTGVAGDLSPEFRNQALLRYNIFRRMVGVQPFVLDAAYNQKAQLASMVIAANGKAAHGIDASWKFYSEEANKATQESMLLIGAIEPEAAIGYLYDYGEWNAGSVGHRQKMLAPWVSTKIGLGSTPQTATTQATEALTIYPSRTTPEFVGFEKPLVLWPAPGYVPNYLITGQWSAVIPDGFPEDWNQTLTVRDVTISVSRNGVPLTVRGASAKPGGNDKPGSPSGVAAIWTIDGTGMGTSDYTYYILQSTGEEILGRPNFDQDVVYHVVITGIRQRVEDPNLPHTGADLGGGAPYNGTGRLEYDVIGYNPDLPSTMKVLVAPVSQNVVAGGSATLAVQATGVASYQWYKDWTAISGATQSWLQLTEFKASDVGSYHCLMSGSSGSILSGYATVSLAASSAQKIANISTRSLVGTGDQVQVAGFVIDGDKPKTVLIRASGPALAPFGIAGALADPQLSLFDDQQQLLAGNDNWFDAGSPASAIEAVAKQVGAFTWTQGSLDAALLLTLKPGHYTAQVAGKNSGTGVALIEVYDAADTGSTRLLNISSRTLVQPGDTQSQVAGFVIQGSQPKTVLIRAVGPTLTEFKVSGALADPQLTLFDSVQKVLVSNDDWSANSGQAGVIEQAAKQVGAFALPSGSKDAALLVTLQPGLYSAQVSSKGSASGVAIIEVYEVP